MSAVVQLVDRGCGMDDGFREGNPLWVADHFARCGCVGGNSGGSG